MAEAVAAAARVAEEQALEVRAWQTAGAEAAREAGRVAGQTAGREAGAAAGERVALEVVVVKVCYVLVCMVLFQDSCGSLFFFPLVLCRSFHITAGC